MAEAEPMPVDAPEAADRPAEPEAQRSILPHFVRPLTAAEKEAAVQARLSALEHASARRTSETQDHAAPDHGGSHAKAPAKPAASTHATADHAPAQATAADKGHGEPAAREATTRHEAPVKHETAVAHEAPKPKLVLARAAPSSAQPVRTGAASRRAPEKDAAPDLSHIHWDYSGVGGPDNWGKLKPEFATCENGNRQSPIDINDGIRVDLEPIEFNYLPSYFRIVDNGHTVQVNVGTGSTIRVMGRVYDLIQFHFHRPSEFRIGGRGYDMEVHLVHQDLDGRLAVVSVMLERGTAHPIVQTLWNNLPLEQRASYAPEIAIDPNDLLPVDRRYATFMGSLTTPPCTEGVMWMVMRQPVQVSVDQISIFSRLHPMNARPLQDMAGRLIKMSR
ncbi:MAG: carbonic anhydrase family protein [Rhodocyclaceae bacterium]|nr:carbonic anhydrase family protein [Rhodocyclaceae bacterium]